MLGSGALDQEITMQTGLHAVGWGLQRLIFVLGVTVFAAVFAYIILVFAIIVVKGVGAIAWGQ